MLFWVEICVFLHQRTTFLIKKLICRYLQTMIVHTLKFVVSFMKFSVHYEKIRFNMYVLIVCSWTVLYWWIYKYIYTFLEWIDEYIKTWTEEDEETHSSLKISQLSPVSRSGSKYKPFFVNSSKQHFLPKKMTLASTFFKILSTLKKEKYRKRFFAVNFCFVSFLKTIT